MAAVWEELKNLPDHFSVNLRQSFVPAEVWVCQLVLIESELVQDGGMDIAKMVRLFDRAQANRVGRSNDSSALNSSTSHPHREAKVVVIATDSRLRFR